LTALTSNKHQSAHINQNPIKARKALLQFTAVILEGILEGILDGILDGIPHHPWRQTSTNYSRHVFV
jgi:hypothetical protein